MKFIRVLKATNEWFVDKISETDWVIETPNGTYKNSDGEDYHFKTKEDALEELDYLRAEHKFDKKSSNTIDLNEMKEIDMINTLVEYFNNVYEGYGWVMPDKLSLDMAYNENSKLFEGMTDEELVKFVKEYNLADIYRFKNLPKDEQAKMIEEDGKFNPEDIILKPTHINYIRETDSYIKDN